MTTANALMHVTKAARESIQNTKGLAEGVASKVTTNHKLRTAILANEAGRQHFEAAGIEVPSAAKIAQTLADFAKAHKSLTDIGIKAPKVSKQTIEILNGYVAAQTVLKNEKFDPSSVADKDRPAFICAVQILETPYPAV